MESGSGRIKESDGAACFNAAPSYRIILLFLCLLPVLLFSACSSPLAKEFDNIYDEYVTGEEKEGEETDEEGEEEDYPELEPLEEEETSGEEELSDEEGTSDEGELSDEEIGDDSGSGEALNGVGAGM